MVNKRYFISVSFMTIVVPFTGFIIESFAQNVSLSFLVFGKWFIFSAVGLRLFVAGMQQTIKPAFTAKEIFHIHTPEALPIVRELGFANICFGLVGIISLFKPEWRIVSSFASGLYYGLAALQHIIKKPASANETFALITDIIIFAVLAVYVVLFL